MEANQNVIFDPRSCSKLKKLRLLNTAKNQMVDLKPLDLISNLTSLDISHNLLADLQGLTEILGNMSALKELDLRGNPLTAILRYRENVIGSCQHLTNIDGKVVEPRSRTMMINLRKMRIRNSSINSSIGSSSSTSSGNQILANEAPTFNISCDNDNEEVDRDEAEVEDNEVVEDNENGEDNDVEENEEDVEENEDEDNDEDVEENDDEDNDEDPEDIEASAEDEDINDSTTMSSTNFKDER